MRFAFIAAHATTWRITTMCRVLQVSRAGFYAWQRRPPSRHQQDDVALTMALVQLHRGRRRRYGSPRMQRELRAAGWGCGKHRVARLMRDAGLRGTPRRAFRGTTRADAGRPVAANTLARQFALAHHPQLNRTWAADITYLPTRNGWLYLAVVLDLASRRVVGWALRVDLTQELALAALNMALTHRRAAPAVHHSDRGAQYTSVAYQQRLAAIGCTPNMSRVGDCWDNAVVESFFATLTKECLGDTVFPTRTAASQAVFEFIEVWYNRQRRHSTLGYCSPAAYEAALAHAG